MRKIKYTKLMDVENFKAKEVCKLKFDNGELISIFDRELQEPDHLYLGKKFKLEEIQTIRSINTALEDKGLLPMTLEEVDYMLNWNKIPDVNNADEIQRLAGFKVEKVITYLD